MSTRNVLKFYTEMQTSNQVQSWFAMRTTYGREKKAYNYIVDRGTKAFYPTTICKHIDRNGKLTLREMSLLPNIFFIFATESEAKSYAYDNSNLPFLRFYYCHHHDGTKEPMIIPECQIENLRIICKSKEPENNILRENLQKFKSGQHVRVVGGPFKGFTGIVARYKGQQCVGVCIDGIGTVKTTYIANCYLDHIDNTNIRENGTK